VLQVTVPWHLLVAIKFLAVSQVDRNIFLRSNCSSAVHMRCMHTQLGLAVTVTQ
jgi:hypothetical protein